MTVRVLREQPYKQNGNEQGIYLFEESKQNPNRGVVVKYIPSMDVYTIQPCLIKKENKRYIDLTKQDLELEELTIREVMNLSEPIKSAIRVVQEKKYPPYEMGIQMANLVYG